ncbi:hypothetical protein MKZ38_005747 [Zalerion maritima]|uniref:Uncharacterized protein n=1 Tax=Zalerion maritima TaxID=339359 RepID=A0AAD5WNT7_9PEZI|nr:hypothetical protein MKZ38_005747 [Zalerion maritima]
MLQFPTNLLVALLALAIGILAIPVIPKSIHFNSQVENDNWLPIYTSDPYSYSSSPNSSTVYPSTSSTRSIPPVGEGSPTTTSNLDSSSSSSSWTLLPTVPGTITLSASVPPPPPPNTDENGSTSTTHRPFTPSTTPTPDPSPRAAVDAQPEPIEFSPAAVATSARTRGGTSEYRD